MTNSKAKKGTKNVSKGQKTVVETTANIFDEITFDSIQAQTGGDLSNEDVCKIIMIHLYDNVLVSQADRVKIKAAHDALAKGEDQIDRPKVDRIAGGRKVSAYQVWLKAQELTKKITGTKVKFQSKSLNNPKMIAGRTASFVSKYVNFVNNPDSHTGTNAAQLKSALKLG